MIFDAENRLFMRNTFSNTQREETKTCQESPKKAKLSLLVKSLDILIPNAAQVQSSLQCLSAIDPNDELIISERMNHPPLPLTQINSMALQKYG